MKLKKIVEKSAKRNKIPANLWPAVFAVAKEVASYYVSAIFFEPDIPHKWNIFRWSALGKKWYRKHKEDFKLEL